MTVFLTSDMMNKSEIEVAYFKSILPDVAGTEEGRGKGNVPKVKKSCSSDLGHAVNSRMTVI